MKFPMAHRPKNLIIHSDLIYNLSKLSLLQNENLSAPSETHVINKQLQSSLLLFRTTVLSIPLAFLSYYPYSLPIRTILFLASFFFFCDSHVYGFHFKLIIGMICHVCPFSNNILILYLFAPFVLSLPLLLLR